MIETLIFAMVGFAGIACFIIFYGIVFQNKESNFTTFALFTVLYSIVAYHSFYEADEFNGFVILMLENLFLAILIPPSFKPEIIDKFSFGFVVAMIATSVFVDEQKALWFISIAVFFAGATYMSYLHFLVFVDKWYRIANTLFLLSSIFMCLIAYSSGRNIVFASTFFAYWLCVVAITFRKRKFDFLNQNKTPKA